MCVCVGLSHIYTWGIFQSLKLKNKVSTPVNDFNDSREHPQLNVGCRMWKKGTYNVHNLLAMILLSWGRGF